MNAHFPLFWMKWSRVSLCLNDLSCQYYDVINYSMHSSIKPKSPLGKLTIESIQLQLNKKSKGSHHFRYKTLPQNSHREIFMPKREIKKEVKAPLDQ